MKIEAIHIISGKEHGYTIRATSADGVYERCELDISDELISGYNIFEEPILEIDGQSIPLGDSLRAWGGEPCIEWKEGDKVRRVMVANLKKYAEK